MIQINAQSLWPHRFWFSLLGLSLLIIFGSTPLLRVVEGTAAKNLDQIKTQRTQTEQALHQLQDDVTTAQKLTGEMTIAEAEQYLAPVDRLLTANILEQEAASSHIRGFGYTLAPEQKIKISGSVPEPQDLSVSTVTLHGEAPSDAQIYNLIDTMPGLLPGRLRLQQLSVERISKNKTAIDNYNLRFNATFEWLSNGSLPESASGI